jgi:sterol desaturase/sphingolipid hydroxylase (fatty acid hydroxylase superfamily)
MSAYDAVLAVPLAVWTSFVQVLRYPVDAEQRLYLPYVLTSLAAALFVYWGAARGGRSIRDFVRFAFPARVWSHPSTRVDLRYFVPHQMVRFWIYTTVLVTWTRISMSGMHAGLELLFGPATAEPAGSVGLVGRVVYAVVVVLLVDFAAFYVHLLQHRIPALWAFHKVHHSAVVLNPFTNYREHPVDNLIYAVVTGFAYGAPAGVATWYYGVAPSLPFLFGVVAPILAFDVLGYHLRHSHIWLRWPGRLAWVFGCPAHHQVHHSAHPDHAAKNLAFMFPIWDVLFGTFVLPEEEEPLEFGLGDGTEARYDGVASIYLLPFKELLRGSSPAGEPLTEVPAPVRGQG